MDFLMNISAIIVGIFIVIITAIICVWLFRTMRNLGKLG